jgi:hypothetical protein
MKSDRHSMITVLCDECGVEFYARKERVEKGLGRFCSKNCFHIWKSKNKTSNRVGIENASVYHKKEGGYFVQYVDGNGKAKNLPWHKWAWQTNFGDIPAGYVVEYKDGNKDNILLDNLELRLTRRGKKLLPKSRKVLSDEHKRKLSKITADRWENGDFDSPEIRAAYSRSGLSTKGTIRNPLRHIVLTPEEKAEKKEDARRRMSESLKGRIFSDEHLQRLTAAVRKRVADGTHNFLVPGEKRSIQPYPEEFNVYLKTKVKRRDGYNCQSCGRNVYGERAGHVHHISGDKQDCDPSNLLLLCATCHNAVHGRNNVTNEIIAYLKTLLKPRL